MAGIEQLDVGYAGPVDAAPEQGRIVHQAHQGGVAAVAGADDADALGVGDTFGDRPFGGVGNVLLHLQAPLLPAGLVVLATEAGAAAKFGFQYGLAAHIGAAVQQHPGTVRTRRRIDQVDGRGQGGDAQERGKGYGHGRSARNRIGQMFAVRSVNSSVLPMVAPVVSAACRAAALRGQCLIRARAHGRPGRARAHPAPA